MQPVEGVTKFSARHDERRLEPRLYGELACRLVAWREIMSLTGLVGCDPDRYGGAGFGNVSARVGPASRGRGRRSMLITGTQTGGRARLALDDFCVVDAYDYQRNTVESRGLVRPSSESMTHGAIYDLAPHIRYVLHAHAPVIWRRARELRLPTSSESVDYGTPEMAFEVHRLYRDTALPEVRLLAMGGHEDGVIAFGHTVEEAGQCLLLWLARAYETECRLR